MSITALPFKTNSSTFFPIPVFSIIVPLITAKIKPTKTYIIAIGHPKDPTNNIKDPKSTNGLDIKKLNVTPLDNPALVNPINIGIDEQLQKGVTVPSNAPAIFAPIPWNLPNIFFVLSGGK